MWWRGFVSGFNGHAMTVGQGAPFDVEAASPEAQWEYIVSYCRSHPHEAIARAILSLHYESPFKK